MIKIVRDVIKETQTSKQEVFEKKKNLNRLLSN